MFVQVGVRTEGNFVHEMISERSCLKVDANSAIVVAHGNSLACSLFAYADNKIIGVEVQEGIQLPLRTSKDNLNLVALHVIVSPFDGGGQVLAVGKLDGVANFIVTAGGTTSDEFLAVQGNLSLFSIAGFLNRERGDGIGVGSHLQILSGLVVSREFNGFPLCGQDFGQDSGSKNLEDIGAVSGVHLQSQNVDTVLEEMDINRELVGPSLVNIHLGVHGPVIEAAISAEHRVQLGLLRNVELGLSINGVGSISSLAGDLVVILHVLFIVPGGKSLPGGHITSDNTINSYLQIKTFLGQVFEQKASLLVKSKLNLALLDIAHTNISHLRFHLVFRDLSSGLCSQNHSIIKLNLKVNVGKVSRSAEINLYIAGSNHGEVSLECISGSSIVSIQFGSSKFSSILLNLNIDSVSVDIKVTGDLVDMTHALDGGNHLLHWDSVHIDFIVAKTFAVVESFSIGLTITLQVNLEGSKNLDSSTLGDDFDNSVPLVATLGSDNLELSNLLVLVVQLIVDSHLKEPISGANSSIKVERNLDLLRSGIGNQSLQVVNGQIKLASLQLVVGVLVVNTNLNTHVNGQ